MTIQYMHGDTRPIYPPIASSQVVAVGDLVGQVGGTLVRATDIAWGTAIATASAPTLTNGAVAVGSPLTNGSTHVKVSYVTPWGETATSAASAVTPTAGATIVVTAVALPTNVSSINYYVETSAGSGVYLLYGSNDGSTYTISGYGDGVAPPATPALSTALQATQAAFVQSFLGVSGQAKAATGFFGLPQTTPYGNSLPVCRVDTDAQYYADIASGTYALGSYVGPAKDTGNDLLNQTVAGVSSPLLAVGMVVGVAGGGVVGTQTTRILMKLISPIKGQ